MISLPKQLHKESFRFVKLLKKSKKPFENDWQQKGYEWNNNNLTQHIKGGGNYGVIGGYGRIRILDIDEANLAKDMASKINTFTVRTGSGGMHFYFLSDYDSNHVLRDRLGELRAKNYQVVGPNCIHPNGQRYKLINDSKLVELSIDEVKRLINPYIKKENDVVKQDGTDTTRSGREFGEVCSLIKSGLKTFEEIDERMQCFKKWVESPQQYRILTFNKASASVEMNHAVTGELYQDIKPLEVNDMDYFKKLKPDRSQLIQGVLGREALQMWYSPPKMLKSIIVLYAGLCVASGKEFLDKKTKKCPVLIIDRENNELIKKDRILEIASGLDLKRKPKLYFLSRGEHVDVFSPLFLKRVEKTIEKLKIKLVVLDTFRRMSPEMKENASDDVSQFHSKFFIPLRDKFGISCIFLHHTTKGEEGYRGSSDIGGMVDTSFRIKKTTEGPRCKFLMETKLSREGVVEKVLGEVSFNNGAITFEKRVQDEDAFTEKKEYVALLNYIRDFLKSAGPGIEVRKKSITTHIETKGVDAERSRRQINNALDYLIESGFADTDKKGKYWKL